MYDKDEDIIEKLVFLNASIVIPQKNGSSTSLYAMKSSKLANQ